MLTADGFVLEMSGKDGARIRHTFSCDKNNNVTIGLMAFTQLDSLAIIDWHPSVLGCGCVVVMRIDLTDRPGIASTPTRLAAATSF